MKNNANVVTRRKPNEKIERTLKRFKRSMMDTRILQDFRENSFYDKPSVKKRKKSARAAIRRKKEAHDALKGR